MGRHRNPGAMPMNRQAAMLFIVPNLVMLERSAVLQFKSTVVR